MDPLAAATAQTFEPHLGELFEQAMGPTLELVEVEELGGAPAGRQPFALLFRGPLDPVLEQGIRMLQHSQLGELGLFLVPVERRADGMRYEAVFT